MQGKRLIHKDDCDSYMLDYLRKPLNPFFSHKNRNKSVSLEPEKLGPYFERPCKTDVHFVSPNEKGKLWALVMDTGRLTKYRSIPGGKKLYVSVFKKSKKIYYKWVFTQRYFLQNRMQVFCIAMGTVFFAVLVFLWGGTFLKTEHNADTFDVALQNKQQTLSADSAMLEKNTVSSQAFIDRLDASLKKGATCTLFDYTHDRLSQNSGAFRTSIRVALTGIYPEEIYTLFYGQNDTELQSNSKNTIEISRAVFKDTVPNLDILFLGKNYASVGSASWAKNDGALRSFVVGHKGNIQTEDLISQSISFNIVTSEWSAFFTALSDHLIQNNLTFKNLSLSCAKNDNTVLAHITLEAGKIPTELNKLSSLFNTQSEWYKNTTKDISAHQLIPLAKVISNTQAKKLGTVIKPNGSAISFYAGADEKIIFEEK